MKSRMHSLDFIRVLAMIMVVVVHTRNFFFSWDTAPLVYLLLRAFGTLGVPLFVLLSGYLMFDRQYSDTEYLEHYMRCNLLPLVISFECWNLLWFLFDQIGPLRYPGGGFPLDMNRVIKAALFMGDTGTALWYLPMTIGLYLGLPIASIAIQKLEVASKKYAKLIFLALVVFGTAIPSIKLVLQFVGHEGAVHPVLSMNIFGASVWGDSVWMLYLLSGWLIKKGALRKVSTIPLMLCGVILPMAGAMVCDCLSAMGLGQTSLQTYSFVLYVITAVCLFELIVRNEACFSRVNEILLDCLAGLSTTSFFTYMIHLFIFGLMCHLGIPAVCVGCSVPMEVLLYIILIAAIVVVSHCFAMWLSKIKPVAKWLLLIK